MDTVSPTELAALRAALLNTSGTVPLHDRFRALFTLKSLKNDEAVKIITEGMFRPSGDLFLLLLFHKMCLSVVLSVR